MENATNSGIFCGHVSSAPKFSHENHGRTFYKFLLEVPRLSGAVDILPVVAAREVLESCDVTDGSSIRIEGQIRSLNSRSLGGRKLIISVYADSLQACNEEPANNVTLTGAICKAPTLRRTPLGREICDIMLAVSRRYHRTDYIPCILWGRTAQETADMPVGSLLELHGRLQSRNYLKVLPDRTEERTAYEVSVMDAYLLPQDFLQKFEK